MGEGAPTGRQLAAKVRGWPTSPQAIALRVSSMGAYPPVLPQRYRCRASSHKGIAATGMGRWPVHRLLVLL